MLWLINLIGLSPVQCTVREFPGIRSSGAREDVESNDLLLVGLKRD
jgi:hypothetical protein